MQRVKTATAIADKPAYSAGGTPGFFRSGDPVAAIPPTIPGQDWFNMMQEEPINVILAAGLTPDPEDDTQLLQAVLLLIAAHAPLPGLATTEAAGISRRATVAEAVAGTAAEPHVTPEGLAAALAANPGGVSMYAAYTISMIGR